MSKIQWTDITWNPVWGCNGGCKYCYARGVAKRFAKRMAEKNFPKEEVELNIQRLKDFKPTFLCYNYNTLLPQKPKKVFICSMSDIAFWNPKLIKLVINRMKNYPQHVFQILTKFPEKIQHIEFPDNVWLGITAENQEMLEKRFPDFFNIKASKHFISFEPLLGAVDLKIYTHFIDWIIIGGMTGANAKPMNADWVSKVINQARLYNTPVFFKSWGKWIYEASLSDGQRYDMLKVSSKKRKVFTFPGSNISQYFYEHDKTITNNDLFFQKSFKNFPK